MVEVREKDERDSLQPDWLSGNQTQSHRHGPELEPRPNQIFNDAYKKDTELL